MDLSVQQLEAVKSQLGWNSISHQALCNDGSDRRYYRIVSNQDAHPKIIMQLGQTDRDRLLSGTYDWISLQEYLLSKGFGVPQVYAAIGESGVIVTSDLGDQSFCVFIEANRSNQKLVLEAYNAAFVIIQKFLSLRPDAHIWTSRSFDFQKLYAEMRFTLTHFIVPLNIMNTNDCNELDFDLKILCQRASEQSLFFTHRDFHSRNLMISDGEIYIIDFQDAMRGAPTYDLASLCFDPYTNLDLQTKLRLWNTGLNLIQEIVPDAVCSWPDVLCQRMLKAIGSYGYLTNTIRRGSYLQYVAPSLDVLEHFSYALAHLPCIVNKLIPNIRNYLNGTKH